MDNATVHVSVTFPDGTVSEHSFEVQPSTHMVQAAVMTANEQIIRHMSVEGWFPSGQKWIENEG